MKYLVYLLIGVAIWFFGFFEDITYNVFPDQTYYHYIFIFIGAFVFGFNLMSFIRFLRS